MFHLSFAWFALLMGIGAWILIGDYVKYMKFEHELKAKQQKKVHSRRRKEVPMPA
jgi:hypothetical protein